MKCEICGKEFNHIAYHLLHSHRIIAKEYYDIYLKKENEGICPICGKETFFLGITKGYRKHCSTKCSSLDNNVQNKSKKTILNNKYKGLTPQEYYDKYIKQPNDGICPICGQSTKFYGVSKGYAKTCCKAHGDILGKQTTYRKYNVKSKNNPKQQFATMIKKYGPNCFSNKVKRAWLTRKQSSNYKDGLEKSVLTNKQRVIKFELKNNCTSVYKLISIYGQGWYHTNLPLRTIKSQGNNYILNDDISLIIDYYNSHKPHNYSQLEKDLVTYIRSIYSGNIIENTKKIISPKELDIYLPELRLAIEFNGLYYHCVERGTPKNYHLMKSLLCREKEIRLIHIYEFENIQQQKQLLYDLIVKQQDNYNLNDFNKNNLLNKIPQPTIIYKQNNFTIYGAGKLYQL